MALSQITDRNSSATNLKRKKGSQEGKLYEKLALTLLAKSGYEISNKGNSNFHDFSIGREVDTGRDGKFDDIVFNYRDQDDTKNLIFLQIKHKQDDYQINSEILSAEMAKAKGGKDGGMRRDFSLQKYFVSYLNLSEELKVTGSDELKNGKIKYVVLFTNIGLNAGELISKGFSLKEAPRDVIDLFTLNKSSKNIDDCSQFYQLGSISENLREVFKKSSDLYRLAKELAQYAVWENCREKYIMKIDQAPMKHYHVALKREVFLISDDIQTVPSEKQNANNTLYREAQFRDDFVDNVETESKRELRDALLEAVRELDESKKVVTDDELKKILKQIKWKVVPNFGESKQKKIKRLPFKWFPVKDEHITDFLESLVFAVNQPKVREFQALLIYSAQDTVAEGTFFSNIFDKIGNSGPELRNRLEKILEIDQKSHYKEKWIKGEKILNFFEEQKLFISVSFIVTAMTVMHESEVMEYGKFKKLQETEMILNDFILNNVQILYINSEAIALSSIKILQCLKTEKFVRKVDNRIFVSLDILKSKENRESVAKAFEFENNSLLIIECRYTVDEKGLEEFYRTLFMVIKRNHKKKIIFIDKKYEHVILFKKIQCIFQNQQQFTLKDDFIDIKDFVPMNDPLKKEIIIFQGQKEKFNLSTLTGINCWDSYLVREKLENEQDIIDTQSLLQILNNDEIEVGSKPLGTSSLEGAYADLYEEIDKKNLIHKPMSENLDSNVNDIYIISGLRGSSEGEKMDNLMHYLGIISDQEKIKSNFGDIGSDGKMQIADDDFNEDYFKQICYYHPGKRIFWVRHVEKESKFFLQKFYSPNFYIKRKFKNSVTAKSLKKLIMNESLCGLYIFYSVNNLQELIDSLQFENKCEEEQFENNWKNGKIKFFTSRTDAEASFRENCKQDSFVHLFKLEDNQIIWCNFYDSVHNLQSNVDREKNEMPLVEEEDFIKSIKDRRVLILADDPGMGKSTTITKLHELKYQSKSFAETHFVFRINLKDHLHAITALDLTNKESDFENVVIFLSKVDLKLNHGLAKNLLLATLLNKMNKISRPVLLVFDGFDEVLDEDDRKKVRSLFNFLKNETSAKLWITTRRHYQENLEMELCTFATQLNPMDEDSKIAYIKKYLQDRCYLILNEKEFAELFVHNDKDRGNIRKYTAAFTDKMKSVFKGNVNNITRFIGTPLQLYLLLEGSVSHFRNWIENTEDQDPNFDYLGKDILEVYENFIERKYSVYFKKMGVKETIRKEQDKFIFNEYNIDFAKSLIVKTNPKSSLVIFKDVVLLAGIIKSHGSNIEFIHATFRDYFAAKTFCQWMWKIPNELTNLNKQEYLLKIILKKPDYEQIRTFIDLELKKISEIESFEKILEHYGAIFEKLFNEILNDAEATMLHVAAFEGNKHIVYFIVNSFKGHKRVLKKLLFHDAGPKHKQTALVDAFLKNDIEITRILLDAAEVISKGTLEEFLRFRGMDGSNVLYKATSITENDEILKELLSRTEKKLNLIINRKKRYSCLNLAIQRRKNEFVKFIFDVQFKHDKNSIKRLLLFWENRGSNALCSALRFNHDIVEYLLDTAKKVGDNNKTLKKMLFHGKKAASLGCAIGTTKVHIVKMLLNYAKSINDDNRTLKHLFLNFATDKTYLFAITVVGYIDLLNFLLETAINLDVEIFKKLIFAVDKCGKNAIVLMLKHGLEDTLTYIQKILKEDMHNDSKKTAAETISQERETFHTKKRFISSIARNKIDEVRSILSDAKNCSKNSNEKLRAILLAVDSRFDPCPPSALHIACYFGHSDIIRELLSQAIRVDDGGATLKDLITYSNVRIKTPFEVLKDGYTTKIAEIVEKLMLEARKNKDETIANILQEMAMNYAGVRYPMSFEEQRYIEYLLFCQSND